MFHGKSLLHALVCRANAKQHSRTRLRRREKCLGAIEGTRTPTPLPVHGPEPCASANSATMAIWNLLCSGGLKPPCQEDLLFYFTGMHQPVKRPRQTR